MVFAPKRKKLMVARINGLVLKFRFFLNIYKRCEISLPRWQGTDALLFTLVTDSDTKRFLRK